MSRDAVDIDAAVNAYLGARRDVARYASYDYCFNYFRSFRDAGDAAALADSEHLQTACLQLGFYLASWGMFRGKADLLNHSAKRLAPVVEAIAAAPNAIWNIDAADYGAEAQTLVFDVAGISARSSLAAARRRW